MKVYIAFGQIYYDAHDMLGVYASAEEARDALIEYMKLEDDNDVVSYDRYYIEVRDMGGKAIQSYHLGNEQIRVQRPIQEQAA